MEGGGAVLARAHAPHAFARAHAITPCRIVAVAVVHPHIVGAGLSFHLALPCVSPRRFRTATAARRDGMPCGDGDCARVRSAGM